MYILCGFVVAGCKPQVDGGQKNAAQTRGDPNLECAALISAANTLTIRGEVENDPAFSKNALISSMTYLNAYAIPKGLKEAEAFAQVKSRRAAVLDELAPDEIMNRAKTCAARAQG